MEAVREDVASEGAAASATAGPNVHGVPPASPDEPLPLSVLVTWAVILLTTAALLWWQSVSYKRAQRRKEELAQEEVRVTAADARVTRMPARRSKKPARRAVARTRSCRRTLLTLLAIGGWVTAHAMRPLRG
jgi:Flp pilus assembly protein TadB